MKKIMFSRKYGLEQAAIELLKTMTRRVAVLPDGLEPQDVWNPVMGIDERGKVHFTFDCIDGKQRDLYPQYQPGEVLAVAQCYSDIPWSYREQWSKQGINLNVQKDGTLKGLVELPGWTNKMFVRADAMPHQIRITDVGIEPLQDITDEDCLREGIRRDSTLIATDEPMPYVFSVEGKSHVSIWKSPTPRTAFENLIQHMMGRKVWADNPWVFVYEFELIK